MRLWTWRSREGKAHREAGSGLFGRRQPIPGVVLANGSSIRGSGAKGSFLSSVSRTLERPRHGAARRGAHAGGPPPARLGSASVVTTCCSTACADGDISVATYMRSSTIHSFFSSCHTARSYTRDGAAHAAAGGPSFLGFLHIGINSPACTALVRDDARQCKDFPGWAFLGQGGAGGGWTEGLGGSITLGLYAFPAGETADPGSL